MAIVRYSFSLNALKDAELIHALEAQTSKSATVRAALTYYLLNRPTNAELSEKIDTLVNRIDHIGQILQSEKVYRSSPETTAEADVEPQRSVQGLDSMIERFRNE